MKNLSQSWITMSLLQLSGILSLPILMLGYYLGQHYSWMAGMTQIYLANTILLLVALYYQKIIHQKKMTTIDFARSLFGIKGSYLCAISMAVTLVGWSSIQMQLISVALGAHRFVLPFLMIVIYLLTYNDLNFLDRINRFILPCIIVSLVYYIFNTVMPHANVNITAVASFKLGLVLALSAGCGLVFDLPTFFRHAKTSRDGLISLSCIFLIFLPMVEMIGIYMGKKTALSQDNWIGNFSHSFNVETIMFLILTGILGICLNLYSCSVVVSRTVGGGFRFNLLCCCVASMLLSLVNLTQYFTTFLEMINVSAEILCCVVLMYAFLKGTYLPLPSDNEKRIHFGIFLLVITFAIGASFFRLNLINDSMLNAALLTAGLMISYYKLARRGP